MKRLLGIALAIGLTAGPAAAFERGTTSADFLKLGLGAAAVGMGEAYTARSGDVNSIFFNPAGLADLGIGQLAATHINWIAETQYEALAYARPLLGLGTVGAGIVWLHMPEIPALDEANVPQGSVSAYDLGVIFSYARDLSVPIGLPGLSGGANLKILHRELAGSSASGLAVDLGARYALNEQCAFGLAASNLGYLSKFEQDNETLPVEFRAGGAYLREFGGQHRVAAMADLIQPLDSDLKAAFGLEYVFARMLSARVGYELGYDTAGLQFGGGVQWQGLALDYAAKWLNVFGLTHYISLSAGFGTSLRELQEDRVARILQTAEEQYSSSRYDEALTTVGEAIAVDPGNARALELQNKLQTVISMMQMPMSGETTPDAPGTDNAVPLTPDQKEELGMPAPQEVKP